MNEPATIEESFESEATGETIHTIRAGLTGGESGTVLLLHGLGDHVGKHRWAIRLFVENGLGVVGFDWPGCGRSSGTRGHLPGFDAVAGLVGEVLDRYAEKPVGVLAHSTGAYLLHQGFSRNPGVFENLRWCWYSSPLVRPDHGQGAVKVAAAKALARLVPRLTLPSGVHPSDCYHVPAGDDPDHFSGLVHNRISVGFGAGLLDAGPLSPEGGVPEDIPFLLTQGSGDFVCPSRYAVEFFRALPHPDKTLLYIAGALHEPFREQHPVGLFSGARAWLARHS